MYLNLTLCSLLFTPTIDPLIKIYLWNFTCTPGDVLQKKYK